MQGNYLSPIIDVFKPILIFAAVLWGAETIITMLIKITRRRNGSRHVRSAAWNIRTAV